RWAHRLGLLRLRRWRLAVVLARGTGREDVRVILGRFTGARRPCRWGGRHRRHGVRLAWWHRRGGVDGPADMLHLVSDLLHFLAERLHLLPEVVVHDVLSRRLHRYLDRACFDRLVESGTSGEVAADGLDVHGDAVVALTGVPLAALALLPVGIHTAGTGKGAEAEGRGRVPARQGDPQVDIAAHGFHAVVRGVVEDRIDRDVAAHGRDPGIPHGHAADGDVAAGGARGEP